MIFILGLTIPLTYLYDRPLLHVVAFSLCRTSFQLFSVFSYVQFISQTKRLENHNRDNLQYIHYTVQNVGVSKIEKNVFF